jgi:hypothetical protein
MNGVTMALLGAGEFDPWSEPVERWVLERSRNPQGPVLVAPTAAAHEGDESFEGWSTKALDHYASIGVRAEVLPLNEDAHSDDPCRLDDALNGLSRQPGAADRDGERHLFWESLTTAMRDGLRTRAAAPGLPV